MKKIATAILITLVSFSAAAETTKTVQVEFWPFRGTLGSSALQVESELSRASIDVCGSLDNLARIENLRLETESKGTISINPNGNPGSISDQDANFLLHEPRVTGQATVVCKR